MLITRLSSIITIAAAVLVENAFVNDMFLQSVGKLESIHVVGNCDIIGASPTSMVRLNALDRNRVNWQVESPFGDYDTTPDTFLSTNFEDLYVHSPHSNNVYVYKSKSGVLNAKLTLNGRPKQFIHFFRNQVLILDDTGTTWLIKNGTAVELQLDSAQSIAFWHMNGQGQLYVDSSKRYIIDDNGDIVQNMTVSVQGDIVDGRGVSLLTNKMWYHVGNKHKLAIDALLGIGDYAVGIAKSVTKFYDQKGKVVNVIATQGDVSILEHQMSEFLVDLRSDNAVVYDLTDFILDGTPSSIKETTIKFVKKVDSKTAQYGISLSADGPMMVLYQQGETFTYSLQTGRLISQFRLTLSLAKQFIVIDRAASKAAIEREHDLQNDALSSLMLGRWLHRVKRHLSELGEFAISQFNKGTRRDFTPIDSGFDKLLVYIDSVSLKVTAISTASGEVVWQYAVENAPDGIYVSNGNVIVTSQNQIWELSPDGGFIDTTVIAFDDATQVGDQLILKHGDDYQTYGRPILNVQFVDFDGTKVWGIEHNVKTWEFSRPGHKVVKVCGHSIGAESATVGIPTKDRKLLYKYLNPNTVAVITGNSGGISLFLLDGVSGQLLFTQSNTRDKVDFGSVRLILKDNFVIYSYYVVSPKVEQRIVVIDLFDSGKSSMKSEAEEVSEFSHDVSLQQFSTKSFIYPERIIDLEVTTTKYGITLRSIIVVTASGQLVEIPKYILNSRRIDNRQLKPEDVSGDFGMMPYEPVIAKNSYSVLNHKIPLRTSASGHSLTIKPTNYESSSVFCYANEQNIFCGIAQPSASFDLLGFRFDKQKLVATIVVIILAYIGVKPFVANKKLNQNWVDKKA